MQGYHIPQGWTITYSIKSTHEQSPNFDDNSAFNPDRWQTPADMPPQDAPTAAPTSGFHYLPFGAGTHSCVGKDYARTMARLFLVLLVRGSDWELLTPDPLMLVVPVVKPQNGLWVKVVARDR